MHTYNSRRDLSEYAFTLFARSDVYVVYVLRLREKSGAGGTVRRLIDMSRLSIWGLFNC